MRRYALALQRWASPSRDTHVLGQDVCHPSALRRPPRALGNNISVLPCRVEIVATGTRARLARNRDLPENGVRVAEERSAPLLSMLDVAPAISRASIICSAQTLKLTPRASARFAAARSVSRALIGSSPSN